MSDIPIYDMLKNYIDKKPTIFHMPGHKMGHSVSEYYTDMIKWDVTEIPCTDDLHNPSGAILEAQWKATTAFGTSQTFFLVNGSTCGIHAVLMAVCKNKDKIIVGRDCHKSVLNILMYLEANIVFVNPEYNSEFGIYCGYNVKNIREALDKNPDSVGVILTSPNYYGICSDIETIAKEVHGHNKVLIVDEAHGAHLKFCERLPKSAVQQGADAVVQSAHKTLPALTQTGYLHINSNRIDVAKVKNILDVIQTSSPSFIFMASLDIARHIMETEGRQRLNEVCDFIDDFCENMSCIDGLRILGNQYIKEGMCDKTRLVINFSKLDIVGYDVERVLMERYNIQVEMSDLYNIVCIATVCDTKENFERLEYALKDIISNSEIARQHVAKLKQGMLCNETSARLVDIKHYKSVKVGLYEAVGQISYNMIVPYPPGIPVIIAGECIKEEHIDYINKILDLGAVVNGIDENKNIEVLTKN